MGIFILLTAVTLLATGKDGQRNWYQPAVINNYPIIDLARNIEKYLATTLQSLRNANLSQHRFWPCYENGLIKTILTIPHNLYVSFKSASLYCGLRLILVYPNPQ